LTSCGTFIISIDPPSFNIIITKGPDGLYLMRPQLAAC
jgi:hypothetical protein